MKKLKTVLAVVTAAMLMVSFTACKKGDTGPKGDTGAQGPAGNANVISGIVYANSTNWFLNNTYWYYDYVVTLSSDIVDKAAVICYLSDGAGGWGNLPYTGNDIEIYDTYKAYTISFRVRSASGNTSITNPGAATFKYVIIPPAMIKPNVNHNNYADVKAAYDLKD